MAQKNGFPIHQGKEKPVMLKIRSAIIHLLRTVKVDRNQLHALGSSKSKVTVLLWTNTPFPEIIYLTVPLVEDMGPMVFLR